MITEVVTSLSPARVIAEARRFFTDEGAFHSATIVEEGENYLTLGMFRSRLAISAFPDERSGETRVRVSTLRRNDAIGRFLALVEAGGAQDEREVAAESA
jgi:hypothetical protein